MSSAAQPGEPLNIERDPFAASAAFPQPSPPLQKAFREIIRQIVLGSQFVLITGSASTGKTLLLDMTARSCADMGFSVRRVDRGDMVHTMLGQPCDVLLVDEAASVTDLMLKAISLGERKSIVFVGLPSFINRLNFSNVHAVIIEVTPLSLSDARSFLLERARSAGWPNLFTTQALSLIVNGSHGSVRMLQSIASFAFFRAASDGATQISLKYAASALAAQTAFDDEPSGALKLDESPIGLPWTDEMLDEQVGAAPTAALKTTKRAHKFVWEDNTPKEDQSVAKISFAKSPSWRRGSKTSAKSRKSARSYRTDLHNVVRSMKMRFRHLSVDPKISRKALATILSVVIAGATIGLAMPLMLAGARFHSAAPPNNTAGSVQAPSFVDQAPLLPTAVLSESISSERKKIHVEEKGLAGGITEAIIAGAAETEKVTRMSLTAEEEAAVARGIRELTLQSAGQQPNAGQHMLVVIRGVNARVRPVRSSKVVATLPRGLKVKMIEQRGSWTLVEALGRSAAPKRGWVFNTFLEEGDG